MDNIVISIFVGNRTYTTVADYTCVFIRLIQTEINRMSANG